MKINYEMITDGELYSRKLEGILGIFLAVIFLCITAGTQTVMPSAEEAPADYLNIAGGLTGDLRLVPEMNERSRLEDCLNLTENPLSKIYELPRMPEIGASNNPTAGETPETAGIDEESMPASIAEESSAHEPEAAITPALEESSSEPVSEDRSADADIPSVIDDAGEGTETFIYGGFLCDTSGMIIGCQDAAVIDGVLCLPLEESCTGIAAGALDAFSAEVFEIYIPQNIITIEEGALDGLKELLFIEVHPGNPAYGSREGMLYKK